MRTNAQKLRERLDQLRRHTQWRIADVLRAIDSTIGSPLERRILTSVLGQLGGEDVVSYLNESSPEDLRHEIFVHVRWLEDVARGEAPPDGDDAAGAGG